MCGIIGYVGGRASKPLLIQGLQRLEYRGYDSAGIALIEEGGLDYVRAVGNLQNTRSCGGPERLGVDDGARPRAGRRTAASRRRTRTR
jgi:glucosamine--fructose-6-phosphate aminotransferase (isomerizing)